MAGSEGHDNLSLYVHVPFCTRKCAYCDFASVDDAPQLASRTVDRTLRELHERRCRTSAFRPRTVYVGGGTPSSLKTTDIRRLLLGIGEQLGAPPLEWTVEANPETVTEAFLDVLVEAGVTRLSLGVQSRDHLVLQRLGRLSTPRGIADALERIRQSWNGRLSVDLITGAGGRSPAEVGSEARWVVGQGATHVSLYALKVEEGTPLHGQVERGEIILPSEEAQEELWFAGRDALIAMGLTDYEISNFSGAGEECLHNLQYWRLEPYLGVGPGAVSTVPRAGRVVRVNNPGNIQTYLQAPGFGQTQEDLGARDFVFETLMMGLRLRMGIERARLLYRFGRTLDELIPATWDGWRRRGLTRETPTHQGLTGGGRMILNTLLVEAGEEMDSREWGSLPITYS